MPAPNTEQPPSPWTLIKDYCQSVITLASALLALSVTFSAALLNKINDTDKYLLIGSWIFLVLVIGFGVASLGFLTSYLKTGNRDKISIFCANAAFASLVLSSLLFLVLGWRIVNSANSREANTIVNQILDEMPETSGMKDSKWYLRELTWDESSKVYQLVVAEEKSAKKYSVVFDTAKKRITDARLSE